MERIDVAVIGGGPAGLMAAEALTATGHVVHVFDAMPSLGRKFLMAGKGGLNLTHAEPLEQFLDRFGVHRAALEPLLRDFGPGALRDWARDLGVDTFVGSSGRVFPGDFKAAPLLRAWLRWLRTAGVRFHVRHRWLGWTRGGNLSFATPAGEVSVGADATILALGGGSWPQLGSDGAWADLLQGRGVPVAPLRPANCGFDADWTAHFRQRFAGRPVKSVVLSFEGRDQPGEFIVTATGIEGGAVYAHSAALRDAIARDGAATITLDLFPGRSRERLARDLAGRRGSRSMATHIHRTTGIDGVKAGLLRECLPADAFADPHRLAAGIKALPLRVLAPRPLAEAISSAGGVPFAALDANLMVRELPGLFCAGEMLDWEAPTGGYLLTACFATGRAAGLGAARWLQAARRA